METNYGVNTLMHVFSYHLPTGKVSLSQSCWRKLQQFSPENVFNAINHDHSLSLTSTKMEFKLGECILKLKLRLSRTSQRKWIIRFFVSRLCYMMQHAVLTQYL